MGQNVEHRARGAGSIHIAMSPLGSATPIHRRNLLQVEEGQKVLEPGIVTEAVIDRINLQRPNAIAMALNGFVKKFASSEESVGKSGK